CGRGGVLRVEARSMEFSHLMKLRWKASDGGGELVLSAGGALVVKVKAQGGEVGFSDGALELGGVFPGEGESDGIALAIEHAFSAPEHLWIPHLTPEDGNVMGDFVFRSPAVILADSALSLALIPDLDDIRAAEGFRVWLDYDHP